MAIPAPDAAPMTPLYRLATLGMALVTAFWALAAVAAASAPAGGMSFAILESGRLAAVLLCDCILTLRVSRGWMVPWDAALAMAPARTSLAGLVSTLGEDGGGGGGADRDADWLWSTLSDRAAVADANGMEPPRLRLAELLSTKNSNFTCGFQTSGCFIDDMLSLSL